MALPSTHGSRIAGPWEDSELLSLSRTDDGVFILCMLAPEHNNDNRWTLPFSRAMHLAFDAIEEALEGDPGPAALITCSGSSKFYSNGIDPDWLMSTGRAGDPNQELKMWNDLTMTAFARPLLLPIPTVAAIGGHCFGAGLMFALGCDHRLMREDRGFLCAPEVAIGIEIPDPELVLFKHAMPVQAFHDTVLSARRWSGADALANGLVGELCSPKALFEESLAMATRLATLGGSKGHRRQTLGRMKAKTKVRQRRYFVLLAQHYFSVMLYIFALKL
jgi:enoyl-CoA hydratase/carnithine racemase